MGTWAAEEASFHQEQGLDLMRCPKERERLKPGFLHGARGEISSFGGQDGVGLGLGAQRVG